jgi:hypothetical protein
MDKEKVCLHKNNIPDFTVIKLSSMSFILVLEKHPIRISYPIDIAF